MADTLTLAGDTGGWLTVLLQMLLFAAGAPLFAGWIKWLKCRLQNRRPPPVWQPYRDLRRLFMKKVLLAENASLLFRITPYLLLGAMLSAAAITPMLSLNLPSAAMMDAIALAGLFAFARFFLALAGLDVGTAFGGMGASREMLVSTFAEPAMLMMVFTVAMVAGSTNLATMMGAIETQMVMTRPSLWFAALGFLMVIVAECGRVPVDNPATHLELTMIHEAMVLEYSGRFLAMIEWAAQLKLLIYAVLAINLFNPWGLAHAATPAALATAAGLLAVKLGMFGVVLAIFETVQAKLRLFAVPTFLLLAFTLALSGLLSFIVLEAA